MSQNDSQVDQALLVLITHHSILNYRGFESQQNWVFITLLIKTEMSMPVLFI